MLESKYSDLPPYIIAHPVNTDKDKYDIVGLDRFTKRIYIHDILSNGYAIKKRCSDGVLILLKHWNVNYIGKIKIKEVT